MLTLRAAKCRLSAFICRSIKPPYKKSNTSVCMCVLSALCYKAAFSYRFVLNEMVQTEKDYVKDLGIVVDVSVK